MKTNSIVTLAVASLLVSALTGFSQSSGIFGTAVAISITNGVTSAFNLYETTLIGDGRLAPNTSGGGSSLGAPSLINGSAWATSVGGGPSLGSFVQGVDTLTLNGGELLTYKNGGANVSAAYVYYSIDSGLFNQITLAFNQDNVNGATGDQRWYTDGANINLLNGLSAGTHTLSIYYKDDNTVTGNDYISNFSANYNSTFSITAVPEPSVLVLGASGLAMFFLVRRRR